MGSITARKTVLLCMPFCVPPNFPPPLRGRRTRGWGTAARSCRQKSRQGTVGQTKRRHWHVCESPLNWQLRPVMRVVRSPPQRPSLQRHLPNSGDHGVTHWPERQATIEQGCPADVAGEENGWDECSADDCPMLPKPYSFTTYTVQGVVRAVCSARRFPADQANMKSEARSTLGSLMPTGVTLLVASKAILVSLPVLVIIMSAKLWMP